MSPQAPLHGQSLPDLSERLVEEGLYDGYKAWRKRYRSWRRGHIDGAVGELSGGACERETSSGDAGWRDKYREWRRGGISGAAGEASTARALPLVSLLQKRKAASAGDGTALAKKVREAPAVIYDIVVADETAAPALVPVDGPRVSPVPVDALPPDALVTVRVFRFFEDRSDEGQAWEQELQNVNSGSLAWVLAHLEPGVHSTQGAKYGKWFTIHYIQVYAKHFKSAYHMANEGSSYPAKTFGSTSANRSTIEGKDLPRGYFWYVSPASSEASLACEGWQHLCRAGPFDGDAFLEHWRQGGSSAEIADLQESLKRASEK